MYDGFRLSRRLTRLSRRLLVPPRAMRSAVRTARTLVAPPPATPFAAQTAGSVAEVAGFGSNPGKLRMLVHVPSAPPRPGAPLLVLLHGCGQDATGFAAAAGFTALADRLGAALLLPEQPDANNPGRCFNWFRPADTGRQGGEAESIRQMVADAVMRFAADPGRVFIAGLSAGGAMAAALLAGYPEVFAGGGVFAGLPVGAATDLSSAFSRMSRASNEPRAVHVARIDSAGRAAGWPKLSVWSGDADHTVDPGNADVLVAQWTGLHGLPESPDTDERVAHGVRRRRWGDEVEQWTLAGFGHGVPTTVKTPTDPFVLQAPVQAADAMARFWGLDPG